MKRIVLLCLITCHFGTLCECRPETSVIQGTLVDRIFNAEGKQTTEWRIPFEVRTSASQWSISIDGIDRSETTHFDGVQTYCVHKHKQVTTNAFAVLMMSDYPQLSSTHCRVLWLAYCSSSYFERGSNWLNVPWMSRSHATSVMPVKVNTMISNSGLPEELVFTSALDKWREAAEIREIPATQRAIPPFQSGQLFGRYKVAEIGVLMGIPIPIRFELTRFNYRNNKQYVLERYTSSVTNRFHSQDSILQVPAIREDISVGDYRFESSDYFGFHVVYHATNNWLARDNSELLKQVQSSRVRFDSARASLKRMSHLYQVLTLAIVATYGTLPFLYCYYRKKQQTNTKL